MNTNTTIVILAAGLGTRMKSRTAKVLHKAGGLSLIEHVVRAATAVVPAERVVVVTGHQADKVEELLSGQRVRFALQSVQKGTGHALEMCRDAVPDHQGELIVLNGDGPLLRPETLELLLSHHRESRAAATVVATRLQNPTGYGRCIVASDDRLSAIVEEKVATPEQKRVDIINSGIWCFDAPVLWRELFKVQPNKVSDEYYLTDMVEILNDGGHRVDAVVHPNPTELLGINTRIELAEVEAILRHRKAAELMLAGVGMTTPDSVLIDMDVRVGMDTVLEPSVQLLGNTVIGENCRIGTGSILRDCRLADGVGIEPYTIIGASVVEQGATIGPFARLRVGNQVGANAHIGNFVELKKTRFGAGAKAGHLAYLGDSEIGAGTNIGAGTITCNFDGEKKHRTTIGEGAFIGSNSTLVAPVEVGKDAYVGAGSAITDSVSAGSLALGRARQVNKEGWVTRREAAKATSGSRDEQ